MTKEKDKNTKPKETEVIDPKPEEKIDIDSGGEFDEHLKSYQMEAELPVDEVSLGVSGEEPKTKRKRGRPKGSTSKKKAENRFTENIEGSDIINGALMLFFIDTALPILVTMVHNKVSKKSKIKANDLKLSAAQKRELEPIADEVARKLSIDGNPMTVLVISLIAIYAGNLIAVKAR